MVVDKCHASRPSADVPFDSTTECKNLEFIFITPDTVGVDGQQNVDPPLAVSPVMDERVKMVLLADQQ